MLRKKLIIMFCVFLIIFSFLRFFISRKFLYSPKKDYISYSMLGKFGEDVFLEIKENIVIEGVFLKQQGVNKSTILYLHGNKGCLIEKRFLIEKLFITSKSNVFAISYRGFGRGKGIPSEPGLKEDVCYAFEYLFKKENVDKKKIYVYGQSLGGACAISLLEKHAHNISGLILENTFLSIEKVIQETFINMKIPLFFLLQDKWDSESEVRKLIKKEKIPNVLLLSLKEDKVVPRRHMETLYKMFFKIFSTKRNKILIFKSFYNGLHNNTWTQNNYFQEIKNFINKNESI